MRTCDETVILRRGLAGAEAADAFCAHGGAGVAVGSGPALRFGRGGGCRGGFGGGVGRRGRGVGARFIALGGGFGHGLSFRGQRGGTPRTTLVGGFGRLGAFGVFGAFSAFFDFVEVVGDFYFDGDGFVYFGHGGIGVIGDGEDALAEFVEDGEVGGVELGREFICVVGGLYVCIHMQYK